jgi:hypothetical protein
VDKPLEKKSRIDPIKHTILVADIPMMFAHLYIYIYIPLFVPSIPMKYIELPMKNNSF